MAKARALYFLTPQYIASAPLYRATFAVLKSFAGINSVDGPFIEAFRDGYPLLLDV